MEHFKPERLSELYNNLKRYYSSMHSKMQDADDLYNQRNFKTPELPEGINPHKSSTATSLIDNLRDQIRTDEPLVDFEAKGTTRTAQEHKVLMQRWGQYILEQQSRHSQIDSLAQAKEDLLLRGAACIKAVVNTDSLIKPPEGSGKAYRTALKQWRLDNAAVWPFEIRALDPIRVFPCPGRHRPLPYILEVQERRAGDMWMEYPDWTDPQATKSRKAQYDPTRSVLWLEYWSAPVYKDGELSEKGWYIIEADGERILEKENPYGFVPYFWSYSGLGRMNYDNDPSYLAKNVLEPVIGELEAEVLIKTAMSAAWQFHVFPRLITTDDPKTARRQFMKGPGAIIKVPNMEQKPVWMEQPPPNDQMMLFMREIQAAISRRFPPALMDRPEGVDAAVHQALLVSQALKPILPIKRALNDLGTDLINGLARLMAVMKLDMNVAGGMNEAEKTRMVKAEDFSAFNFQVTFEAVDPAENDRRMLVGTSLLRIPGLMSRQTWREVYGKQLGPSNEEEEERVLAERIVDQMVQSGMLLQFVLQEQQAQDQVQGEEELAGRMRQEATSATQNVAGVRERALEGIMSEGGVPQGGIQTPMMEGEGEKRNV